MFNFFKKNAAQLQQEDKTAPAAKRVHKFVSASSALGQTTAPSWTQFMGRTLLTEGFEQNTWVMACVRRRAQALSSVPLVVESKRGDDWVAAEDSPLARLLADPNPFTTSAQLTRVITSQLDIQGEFFARVVRGGRGGLIPLEIWPLPIGSVKTLTDGSRLVGYEYTPPGKAPVPLQPDQVLHLKYTHPDNAFIGMPPLIAGGKAVDVDNEAAGWQKVTMQNRGVPDGVFRLLGEVEVDEWEEARRQVRAQYNTRDSAREPWVLGNAEYQQLSMSPVDLDFMEGRRMTRQEICAALDVPPPLVGIYDDATLANIETARKIFWRDSLLPLSANLSDQLTQYFAPQFGGRGKIRIVFDTTNVAALRESLSEKVQTAKALWEMGTPLEVINRRLELGLSVEDIPGAATGYTAAGLLPVEPAGAGAGVLSDSDFDRLMKLIEAVAAGDIQLAAAVAIGKAAVPGLSESEIRGILAPGAAP